MHGVHEAVQVIDTHSPPHHQYVQEILTALCERLACSYGVVTKRDEAGRRHVVSFAHSAEMNEHSRRQFAATLAAEPLVSGNELCILHDPAQETVSSCWREFFRTQQFNTIIALPLSSCGQLFGECYLCWHEERQFSESDMAVLNQIGETIASAMAGCQYLDRLGRRLQRMGDELVERKEQRLALRKAVLERKVLEEIINRSPVVVARWRMRDGWAVEFVSKSIQQFGYTPEEFYQKTVTFSQLIDPVDNARVSEEITQHLHAGEMEFTSTFRVITKSGDIRVIAAQLWVQHEDTASTPDELLLQGIIQDVTARQQVENSVRYQAYHDALTDLPNHLLFYDRVTTAITHAKRNNSVLAVMFLDIDRFITVNDTLGHAMGDLLLQAVAERLRTRLREEDTVSRLGGDQFSILLPGISLEEDASLVANKIMSVFEAPFMLEDKEVFVTCCLGCSLYPRDGESAQVLLKNADTALYRAKEQGNSSYQFFASRMETEVQECLTLENQLRHALDREEFVVHYQPQIEISSGRLVGVESLIRWEHPESGVISPSKFIPLAEETGLIEPIGEWVLNHVCQKQKEWIETGYPAFRVAVNLSARQFHQRNLVKKIEQVLNDTGMDPHHLDLEITEGVAMRDVDASVSIMRGLKSMGIHLSMDDFGVGYSSLMYFKQFPINTLKIDRSFISGLSSDPSDEAIVTAIIAMARSLHLQVIAEGVETDAQLAFLRHHRCDGIQGYLFSKPLPEQHFLRFLQRMEHVN